MCKEILHEPRRTVNASRALRINIFVIDFFRSV